MTGIYIHIPFCLKKCKYCDFISFDYCNETIKEKYVETLIKEIKSCKINKKIDTIYIGGGTPSIINGKQIGKILDSIYDKFDIANNSEITIEVNPGTVDLEKLKVYKEKGINRLSIGLQSTHDKLLKLLGRIHKYKDFEKIYIEAREIRL